MASVKVGAEQDVVETVDKLIDYWLEIYLDRTRGVEVRNVAAARLDELLRAPAWPS